SQIEFSPDGRLVCLLSEPGVRLYYFSPNLICVSDGTALGPDSRPGLVCVACLESDLGTSRASNRATFPYAHLADGRAAGDGARPAPSLTQQANERFRMHLYGSWLGQVAPLDAGRLLVPIFHQLMRGGTKGAAFAFALVSPTGEITGRLNGIDP